MISQNEWFTVHGPYTDIQSKAPLLAAQALTDTPVGYGGWISHLHYPVSDGYDYDHEELIRNTMIIWIQGTFGNLRSYVEAVVCSDNMLCLLLLMHLPGIKFRFPEDRDANSDNTVGDFKHGSHLPKACEL